MNSNRMLGNDDTAGAIIDAPRVFSKTFLDLPKELRDVVYDLCLIHKPVQQYEHYQSRRYRYRYIDCDCFRHPLLRVCHLTRHEMLARFGTEHEFQIKAIRGDKIAFHERLSVATPELVASIRHLHIITHPHCPCCYHAGSCTPPKPVRTTLLLSGEHVDVKRGSGSSPCELDLRGWSLDKVAILSTRLPRVEGRVYLTKPMLSEIIEALRWPCVQEVRKAKYLILEESLFWGLWHRMRRNFWIYLLNDLYRCYKESKER
jgi:hypothetical protein